MTVDGRNGGCGRLNFFLTQEYLKKKKYSCTKPTLKLKKGEVNKTLIFKYLWDKTVHYLRLQEKFSGSTLKKTRINSIGVGVDQIMHEINLVYFITCRI